MNRRRYLRVLLPVLGVLAAIGLVLGVLTAPSATATGGGGGGGAASKPGHVFLINLENKGFDETWGPGSAAPFLSTTLRRQGVLFSQYYGTGHESLDNYLAQVSGQGPDAATQSDCQVYAPFLGAGTVAPGQAVGQGCVYPSSVPTLAGQLTASGHTWRGYMEDMGTPCRHPALGAPDDTQRAKVGDQYAARHNPFVYFASITGSPDCARNDVDLRALPTDLRTVATTPNLSYITPNLCDDGHDAPCVDGRPGGLTSADLWLRTWVPRIQASPAYRQDGIIVITFDESDGPDSDSTACCGEGPGPNSPRPGITGPGGGRIGALVLSPFAPKNATVATPANHYSLLAALEDGFGVPRLGYATQAPSLPLPHRS